MKAKKTAKKTTKKATPKPVVKKAPAKKAPAKTQRKRVEISDDDKRIMLTQDLPPHVALGAPLPVNTFKPKIATSVQPFPRAARNYPVQAQNAQVIEHAMRDMQGNEVGKVVVKIPEATPTEPNEALDVKVATAKQALAVLQSQVEALVITTPDEYNVMAEYLSHVKLKDEELQGYEDAIIVPANLAIKNTKALFAPAHNLAKAIESIGKQAMKAFDDEADKKKVQAVQAFSTGRIKEETMVAKVQAVSFVRTASKTRKVWKMAIVDEALIPREYLVPDTTKITNALRAGLKVEGTTWTQENQIAI